MTEALTNQAALPNHRPVDVETIRRGRREMDEMEIEVELADGAGPALSGGDAKRQPASFRSRIAGANTVNPIIFAKYVIIETYHPVGMYTKSAATIAKIFAAAQTLFLSKNYADVTMTEIAETSRVTKGALYHHFPSKEALYLAMMHADLQEKQALFRPAVESSGTCRERLRRLTQAFLQLPREKRDLIKLVRRDVNIFKDPLRDQLIRAYQATLPEQIEVIIRDGIRDGELASADPRLLSWLHVATVEVILTRYAKKALKNQEAMLDFVINLFFGGAGKTTA